MITTGHMPPTNMAQLRRLRGRLHFDAFWYRLGCDPIYVWNTLHRKCGGYYPFR